MDSAHHTRLHHSHSVLRHIAKLWFPSGLIPSIVLPHYRSVVISVIVPTRLILSLALRGLMILGSLPYYSRHQQNWVRKEDRVIAAYTRVYSNLGATATQRGE